MLIADHAEDVPRGVAVFLAEQYPLAAYRVSHDVVIAGIIAAFTNVICRHQLALR